MTDDYIYQLIRIGPTQPTCKKVPDVMKLSLGLTRIGRGQHNDFYLDSALLKNFISRLHVEILGKKNENGEVEFILTDKGLNGTFINDIRTHKTCTIEVGDKITFGHTNGYKIQPGSYAEQPQSEFQFEFQKIPKSSKTSEMFSESLSSPNAPCEDSNDSIPDLKKEATDRLFLSNIQPHSQASSKTKQSQKSRARKDSSSQSDNDYHTSKSSSRERNTRLRRRRSSENSDSDSPDSGKSPPRESTSRRRNTRRRSSGSTGKPKQSLSATVAYPKREEESPEQSSDSEAEQVKSEAEEVKSEPEPSDEDIEEPVEEPPKKRTLRRGKQIQKKPAGRKKAPVDSDSDDSSEDDDDSSKPEADQKPKYQGSSTRNKQPQQPVKKKRAASASEAPPAVAGRKKRKRGGGPSSPALPPPPPPSVVPGANLEPGVEWYEDETCDSPDCKRPKKKRTPWVQCDDCDGWYHTVCVGANYNKLKDSDEHFNCGCE